MAIRALSSLRHAARVVPAASESSVDALTRSILGAEAATAAKVSSVTTGSSTDTSLAAARLAEQSMGDVLEQRSRGRILQSVKGRVSVEHSGPVRIGECVRFVPSAESSCAAASTERTSRETTRVSAAAVGVVTGFSRGSEVSVALLSSSPTRMNEVEVKNAKGDHEIRAPATAFLSSACEFTGKLFPIPEIFAAAAQCRSSVSASVKLATWCTRGSHDHGETATAAVITGEHVASGIEAESGAQERDLQHLLLEPSSTGSFALARANVFTVPRLFGNPNRCNPTSSAEQIQSGVAGEADIIGARPSSSFLDVAISHDQKAALNPQSIFASCKKTTTTSRQKSRMKQGQHQQLLTGNYLLDLCHTIRPGQRVILKGPQNAGKTTFLSQLTKSHREGQSVVVCSVENAHKFPNSVVFAQDFAHKDAGEHAWISVLMAIQYAKLLVASSSSTRGPTISGNKIQNGTNSGRGGQPQAACSSQNLNPASESESDVETRMKISKNLQPPKPLLIIDDVLRFQEAVNAKSFFTVQQLIRTALNLDGGGGGGIDSASSPLTVFLSVDAEYYPFAEDVSDVILRFADHRVEFEDVRRYARPLLAVSGGKPAFLEGLWPAGEGVFDQENGSAEAQSIFGGQSAAGDHQDMEKQQNSSSSMASAFILRELLHRVEKGAAWKREIQNHRDLSIHVDEWDKEDAYSLAAAERILNCFHGQHLGMNLASFRRGWDKASNRGESSSAKQLQLEGTTNSSPPARTTLTDVVDKYRNKLGARCAGLGRLLLTRGNAKEKKSVSKHLNFESGATTGGGSFQHDSDGYMAEERQGQEWNNSEDESDSSHPHDKNTALGSPAFQVNCPPIEKADLIALARACTIYHFSKCPNEFEAAAFRRDFWRQLKGRFSPMYKEWLGGDGIKNGSLDGVAALDQALLEMRHEFELVRPQF
ncbi:unnamed protein product [Amoebophrya sp. A120]|nr:unnamed protein product [Amoebophrya sp. A120]|eukprot:GSA120T00000240001.1